jgi:hypothetical protein
MLFRLSSPNVAAPTNAARVVMTVKYALIGSACDTESSIELGPTRFPICTCTIPAIAVTSKVTLVHSTLSSAQNAAARHEMECFWANPEGY